jgi:hypothetical protein
MNKYLVKSDSEFEIIALISKGVADMLSAGAATEA